MKTRLLFAALLAATFSFSAFAQDPVKPTTAPPAPTHDATAVKALYCNAYSSNNLNFNVLGWGGVATWETLTIDNTNILYCQDMKYEFLTNWDAASYDMSEFEKLHFDVWVPKRSHIKFTIEALGVNDGGSGFKHGVDFTLNEGWNTIDADPVWWNYNDGEKDIVYDWKDVKYICFEGYTYDDAEKTSAEGTPFAFTNIYFFKNITTGDKPETVPAAPAHKAENVLPLYSTAYNAAAMTAKEWGSKWEKLTIDGTDVIYTSALDWDAFSVAPEDATIDASAFEKLHVDLWVPQASKLNIKIEGTTFKRSISFNLNEGWNTIDCDPVWWDTEEVKYDWKDVKFIIFENYLRADETSAIGNPFAFTNVYFWKAPTVELPKTNPAVPTLAENGVIALFSGKYKTNTYGFTGQAWGDTPAWQVVNEGEDTEYFFTAGLKWDAFTNWDADHYEIPETYDTFHADIYVTVDAKMKFNFEALGVNDGGSGWKNGLVVENLKANEWNSVNIDLLNAPFIDYQFKDVRYLILDGFKTMNDESAEGTPVGVANAYFYDSATVGVENISEDNVQVKKYVEDGQIVIERNGIRYNVLGAEL